MEEIIHGLKEFDNSSATLPRHKQQSAVDDIFETKDDLYYEQTKKYDIVCELDPYAMEWMENGYTKTNSKCLYHFTPEDNALEQEFLLPDGSKPTGVWTNHPYSYHKECLEHHRNQWQKHDLDILSIISTVPTRPPWWNEYVQQYLNQGIIVEPLVSWTEEHGLSGYVSFLKKGKPTKYESRNPYLMIRYFSKKSWTRFIKSRCELMKGYGNEIPTS